MRRFRNASEILPAELYKQVRQHVTGCYLWIPLHTPEEKQQRNAYIVHLYEDQGLSTREISKRVYLSSRRIRQILAEWRFREPEG